jgi:cobalt-zinc-cadmium efflux system protein
VVIAGVVISYTGWVWLDPIIGLVIAAVILGSTWRLLSDSVRLSLDGVPAGIDLEAVLTDLKGVTGVRDIHHIHVWAMSTTENALTAHLVLQPGLSTTEETALKADVRHRLQHLGIGHATLETEVVAQEDCGAEVC